MRYHLLLILLFAFMVTEAQVYRITPKYQLFSSFRYDGKKSRHYFVEPIRTADNKEFVVDLGERTVTIPGKKKPVIQPIDEIVFNGNSNSYQLKMKPLNDELVKERYHIYTLQLDPSGKPVFLKESYNLKENPSRDSLTTTYTSDLLSFDFILYSQSMQSGQLVNGTLSDKAKRQLQPAFNRIQKQGNTIQWTENNSGNEAVHHLTITQVTYDETPEVKKYDLDCRDENGEAVTVSYFYTEKLSTFYMAIATYRGRNMNNGVMRIMTL